MPIGNHLAVCGTCGRQWIVGDCIPSECPTCECKRLGHLPITSICGRCGQRLPADRRPVCVVCRKPIDLPVRRWQGGQSDYPVHQDCEIRIGSDD